MAKQPTAMVSPSRTYIVTTNFEVAKKFRLPDHLQPNSSYIAAAWFAKLLSYGEHVLVVIPYESVDFIKELQDLPLMNGVDENQLTLEQQMNVAQAMGPKTELVLDEADKWEDSTDDELDDFDEIDKFDF